MQIVIGTYQEILKQKLQDNETEQYEISIIFHRLIHVNFFHTPSNGPWLCVRNHQRQKTYCITAIQIPIKKLIEGPQ